MHSIRLPSRKCLFLSREYESSFFIILLLTFFLIWVNIMWLWHLFYNFYISYQYGQTLLWIYWLFFFLFERFIFPYCTQFFKNLGCLSCSFSLYINHFNSGIVFLPLSYAFFLFCVFLSFTSWMNFKYLYYFKHVMISRSDKFQKVVLELIFKCYFPFLFSSSGKPKKFKFCDVVT